MTSSGPVQDRVVFNVRAHKILQVVPCCGEHLGMKWLMELNLCLQPSSISACQATPLTSGQRIGHLVLIDEDPALALHFGQKRGELLIGELLLEQGADGAGERLDGAGLC